MTPPDSRRVASVRDLSGVVLEILLENAERRFAQVSGEVVGRRVLVEFSAPPFDLRLPEDKARLERYQRFFSRDLAHLNVAPQVLPPRPGDRYWSVEVHLG